MIWAFFGKLKADPYEALHAPAPWPEESNRKNLINSFQYGASLQAGKVIHPGGVGGDPLEAASPPCRCFQRGFPVTLIAIKGAYCKH